MKIFELIGSIIVDTTQARRNLRDLESNAQQTGSRLERVSDGIARVGNNISNVGSKMSGFGTGMMAKFTLPIVGAITGAVMATQELRQEMAKLDTAFEASAHSVDRGREAFRELYKVVGDEGVAVEAAQQLAILSEEEEDLVKMTNALTGVYGTFGASLPIEGLAEAVNHTAKLGEVQGPLADAFEWVGVSIEEENEKLASLTTEQERAAYLADRLNSIYSNEADLYRKNAAGIMEQRDAQLNFNEALSELAETFVPIITELTNVMAGLIEKFNNLSDGQKDAIIKIGGFLVIIGPLVAGLGFMASGIGSAVTAGGQIIGMFGKLGSASTILNTIMRGGIGLAFSPAGWIIIGIGLVIGAIYLLIKNFDKVKAAAVKVGDVFANVFTWLGDKISSRMQEISNFIMNPIDTIKNKVQATVDWIKNAFNFVMKGPELKMGNLNPFNWGKNKSEDLSDELNDMINRDKKVKFFAKGGIMNSATEFARSSDTSYIGGEAGREAILPLEGKHMTPFADAIADRIDNKSGETKVENNFHIAQLVVREEADVRRIAIELEKQQKMTNRNRGVYG